MPAIRGESLSDVVEEMLESEIASIWFDELAESLGLGDLPPIDPYDVPKSRPKGFWMWLRL